MRNFLFLSVVVIFFCSCAERGQQNYLPVNQESICESTAGLYAILGESADIFRSQCTEIADDYLKDPQLTSVTREYGKTVINTKKKQISIKSPTAEASIKPWSSWWYPRKESALFSPRETSPLGKFDKVRRWIYQGNNKDYPGDSSESENKFYDPHALAWEGLCDAWSLAAVSVPEPAVAKAINIEDAIVKFSPSDLKALVLKTFEAVDDSQLKYFGQKFTGDHQGWIYPDLFPDQFHRFIEVQLFEKKRAFVMDHDPGPQVWNVPVFKANYVMESLPDKPDTVKVTMWLYTAEPALPAARDIMGTREAVREYHYILEGERKASGEFVVKSGYWIKDNGVDSRMNHPDYFIEVTDPKSLKRKSWNPLIEVQFVDWILQRK